MKQVGGKKKEEKKNERVLQGKKRVETYMSPELAQRLTDYCVKTGLPYWVVIEAALTAHLDGLQGKYWEEEQQRVHIQFDSQGRPHYPEDM